MNRPTLWAEDRDTFWTAPRWLPVNLYPRGEALSLVEMDRDAYRASAFLDDRRVTAGPQQYRLPLTHFDAPPRTPLPAAYIWHTAYCCSTLLTRAFESNPISLVLREPPLFSALLGHWVGGSLAEADVARWAIVTHHLAARRFSPGVPTIVKLKSVCGALLRNFSAAWLTGLLFLFSDLQGSIVSYARNPRRLAEVATKVEAMTRGSDVGADLRAVSEAPLSFERRAALLWLLHVEAFERFVASHPEVRLASLNCSQLLAEPRAAIAAAGEVLGLASTTVDFSAADLLRRDSKRPDRDYPVDERRTEREQIGVARRAAIADAVTWAARLRPRYVQDGPPLQLRVTGSGGGAA